MFHFSELSIYQKEVYPQIWCYIVICYILYQNPSTSLFTSKHLSKSSISSVMTNKLWKGGQIYVEVVLPYLGHFFFSKKWTIIKSTRCCWQFIRNLPEMLDCFCSPVVLTCTIGGWVKCHYTYFQACRAIFSASVVFLSLTDKNM